MNADFVNFAWCSNFRLFSCELTSEFIRCSIIRCEVMSCIFFFFFANNVSKKFVVTMITYNKLYFLTNFFFYKIEN